MLFRTTSENNATATKLSIKAANSVSSRRKHSLFGSIPYLGDCSVSKMAINKLTNMWIGVFLIFLLAICENYAWDSDEMELFDLIEDINKNFYEVMGIDQDASNSEIRKAYRRLSLQFHPDKNKKKDAEEKFRQIVAIYEVLKDEEKRKLYDNVLERGLPTWRQPVYYYRRVRKMSLLELLLFLFLLSTGAQYVFAWSVYIEKKYELEEILTSKFRKKEKKARKNKACDFYENDSLLAQIEQLPKPKYQDLLPFKLYDLLLFMIKAAPQSYQKLRDICLKQPLDNMDFDSSEETDAYVGERFRKPNRRKAFEFPDASSGCLLEAVDEPDLYAVHHNNRSDNNNGESVHSEYLKENDSTSSKQWSEEELILLTKAVNKYPGGIAHRWEKIAAAVGRSTLEVIATTKRLKSSSVNGGLLVSTGVQGITGDIQEKLHIKGKSLKEANESNRAPVEQMYHETHISTQANEMFVNKHGSNPVHDRLTKDTYRTFNNHPPLSLETRNNSKDGSRSGQNSVMLDDNWSQVQQKALELALTKYPKGTDERWVKVANCVPGKTKDECIIRYKYLVEFIKKKRRTSS